MYIMASALVYTATTSTGLLTKSIRTGCSEALVRHSSSGYVLGTKLDSICTQRYFSQNSSDDSRDSPYQAFTVLARREKSWNRLRHLIDLAVDYQDPDHVRSVVDVGTDHGLLAIGLGVSGSFDSVLGVDVSAKALHNGGFRLLSEVKEHMSLDSSPLLDLEVDFRISDGLRNLQVGEADAICIAGMGVNTMSKILESSSLADGRTDLDYLGCQQLILQPTNSKPRNLMKLYSSLQATGWVLVDERIEHLSSRWYITLCMVKKAGNNSTYLHTALPTSKLANNDTNTSMKKIVQEYWEHHLNWIDRDEQVSRGELHEDDKIWREWALGAIKQS